MSDDQLRLDLKRELVLPTVPKHWYRAPHPRAKDQPCAFCGRALADPVHLTWSRPLA